MEKNDKELDILDFLDIIDDKQDDEEVVQETVLDENCGDITPLSEIYSPKECLAIYMPTAEEVIKDSVKTYPSQFEQTKKVFDENPDLFEDEIFTPRLDGIISEYIKSLL